jgi:excinuclease ABC subunit B
MPGAFKLHAPYPAAGDQPAAIDKLVSDVQAGTPRVVLRGATGTGKTFVLANLIARTNRPTLIMAPNKVLAAQLFSELKVFFPQNSVTIFFSHFDFYRPESYAPVSQSYVEKSSQTNPKIDALRHAATRSLFERRDTIVIATVSCI